MRVENWPSVMLSEIGEHDRAFAWGVNDCCIFAADVVRAITGIDHMAAFRGRYDSQEGAREAILATGCKSLRQYMTRILGPLQPAAHARRGDVVFQKGRGLMGARLGVCVGGLSAYVGESEDKAGIIYEQTLLSDGCWHV